jgi:hypothetical protein
MRSAGITPKSIIIAFLAVVALYFISFKGIEHLRHRKGPWQVIFGRNAAGDPALTISQPSLKLDAVYLVVHGERTTNIPGVVTFDQVERPVPYGRVIYEDLTFLPGVVTFDLFGHEVELLPRVLIVNKRAVPWRNGMTVDLWPTNKPATPPQPPKQKK